MRARSARVELALVAALVLLVQGGAPRPARGEAPAPDDPPLCREAILAEPSRSALDALARAEEATSRRAREATAAARRVMHKNIGGGPQEGLAAADEADALLRQAADARRDGRALCLCRERRGDPDREDCEYLYPEPLP